MKRIAILAIALFAFAACSVQHLETSKSYYRQAREAQESGNDLQAILYWKKVKTAADQEIAAGRFPATNYFMRASALIELGDWDQGFADLKQVPIESLSNEEMWIYPVYSILMGDYYAQQNMPLIAGDFYQSVLKKSNLKTASVYILALERQINNSIRQINEKAAAQKDPENWKLKQYADLSGDLQKFIEDNPFSGVARFLMGDLLLKQHRADEALQSMMAALEMGLPTQDLKRSTEFEIATLLTDYSVSSSLKSALLKRAKEWWSSPGSMLSAGENTVEWALQQRGFESQLPPATKIRYVAVMQEGQTRILAWEQL